jgi:hypothetical protein
LTAIRNPRSPDYLHAPVRQEIKKIVCEIVHLTPMSADEISAAEDEPVLIEGRGVRDGNGSGGLNEDTARTKR